MAKSIDRCVTEGCFGVAAKGLNICLSCWDDLCVSSLGDVCQVSNCLNVPDEGETVCSSCWTIHDNANLPGFPGEFDEMEDQEDLVDTLALPAGEGDFYNFRAEDFDLSVKVEGSLSGEEALCDGCGKEECFCSFIDLVESDWAESVAEQEEELTDCTQSCKEMGMMSEGCDFCQ